MSGYTPGPWSIDNCDGGFAIRPEDTGWLLSFISSHAFSSRYHDAEANARLMAAAPELLEALETLSDDCKTAGYHFGSMDMAERAIAKARGEDA